MYNSEFDAHITCLTRAVQGDDSDMQLVRVAHILQNLQAALPADSPAERVYLRDALLQFAIERTSFHLAQTTAAEMRMDSVTGLFCTSAVKLRPCTPLNFSPANKKQFSGLGLYCTNSTLTMFV